LYTESLASKYGYFNVVNSYVLVYEASYMMKNEKAMGHLLTCIAQEVRHEEFNVQLKKWYYSTFLTHREING